MVKTITINDRAYEALAARKRSPKDSFSKVILRMTGEKGTVRDTAGAWKGRSKAECDALVEMSRLMFDSWNNTSGGE